MKYVKIDKDSDLEWLKALFNKQVAKSKSGLSKLDLENVLMIERLAESFNHTISEQELIATYGHNVVPSASTDDAGIEPLDIPQSPRRKRRTKAEMQEANLFTLCPDHPTYTAKKAPRRTEDCKTCWDAYKKFNPLTYQSKRTAWEQGKAAIANEA